MFHNVGLKLDKSVKYYIFYLLLEHFQGGGVEYVIPPSL